MNRKNLNAAGMLSAGRARATGSSGTDATTGGVDDQSTSGVVDEQPVPTPLAYVKVATSLTPEQRRWIKDTPGRLRLDGVSASDVVRLGLTRLRAEVDDEQLARLLVEQAHREAQQMAGRKNRGLPPR